MYGHEKWFKIPDRGNCNLKSENEINKTQIRALMNQNWELRKRVIEIDLNSKKKKKGIINSTPFQEGEDLKGKIKTLSSKLDAEQQDHHLCTTHRLPSNKQIPQ